MSSKDCDNDCDAHGGDNGGHKGGDDGDIAQQLLLARIEWREHYLNSSAVQQILTDGSSSVPMSEEQLQQLSLPERQARVDEAMAALRTQLSRADETVVSLEEALQKAKYAHMNIKSIVNHLSRQCEPRSPWAVATWCGWPSRR